MDALLPNTDQINQTVFTPNPTDATLITVDNGARFQAGDQVRPDGLREVMFVTGVSGNDLTVVRGYGGTVKGPLANDMKLTILGNAALEGDGRPAARFTSRTRRRNYTQIFTAGVEVSGTMRAVKSYGVEDEVDYQKQERVRELLRDLENCVINGVAPASNQVGGSGVRRTMNGIIPQVTTNVFEPGNNGFPDGGGTNQDELTEEVLNTALRRVWEKSSGGVDTILVNGVQKRRINGFVAAQRTYLPTDTKVRDLVSVYESDFGVCRVVVSRWVPEDMLVVLDSSRLGVLPMSGRSFGYKALASGGDSEVGQVIGEYTLEMKNESAHGIVRSLAV